MSDAERFKLVVLGIDGASWKLLDILMNKGRMPKLKEIVERSAYGTLESIVPPVTGPAWPAMATGLNPGRVGAFDFYNRRSVDELELYPVRADQISGMAYWDILSARGFRIGILNYPMLLPCYPLNGWMVAGIGAGFLQEWAFPEHFQKELLSLDPPYEFIVPYASDLYANNTDLLLRDYTNLLKARLAALNHLIKRSPVDILVPVISVSDFISHTMWHWWDEDHPHFSRDEADDRMEKLGEIWEMLDGLIDDLSRKLDDGGHLMIVSDHGFGPNYGVFHINTWLEENGFLVRKNLKITGWSNKLKGKLIQLFGVKLEPFLKKLQGSKAHLLLRPSVKREIDLYKTQALALETTDVFGMVFLNQQYFKKLSGGQAENLENTKKIISKGLVQFGMENNLSIKVMDPAEIYHGEKTSLSPEIIFSVDDGRVSVSHYFGESVFEKKLFHPIKTGNHRMEGVFIGFGPGFVAGQLSDRPNLLDIAPTVYHLLGEAIPLGLDGDVMLSTLNDNFQKIRYLDKQIEEFKHDDAGGSQEDDEMIKERLKELGYL